MWRCPLQRACRPGRLALAATTFPNPFDLVNVTSLWVDRFGANSEPEPADRAGSTVAGAAGRAAGRSIKQRGTASRPCAVSSCLVLATRTCCQPRCDAGRVSSASSRASASCPPPVLSLIPGHAGFNMVPSRYGFSRVLSRPFPLRLGTGSANGFVRDRPRSVESGADNAPLVPCPASSLVRSISPSISRMERACCRCADASPAAAEPCTAFLPVGHQQSTSGILSIDWGHSVRRVRDRLTSPRSSPVRFIRARSVAV